MRLVVADDVTYSLHMFDVIASSLRTDEFWHFRSVLLYERSHTVIQLNAQCSHYIFCSHT